MDRLPLDQPQHYEAIRNHDDPESPSRAPNGNVEGNLGVRASFNIASNEILSPSATKRYWITVGVGFVVLLCSFLTVFNQQLQMKQALADVNTRMDAYVANNDKLMSEIGNAVQSQRKDATSQFQQIGKQMSEMSSIITRLSNRTTNADVLEQLKVTYSHMQGDMSLVQEKVDLALKQTQLDINAQLKSNNTLFENAQKQNSFVFSQIFEIFRNSGIFKYFIEKHVFHREFN